MNSFQKRLKLLTDKKEKRVTEEEIIKSYEQVSSYVGKKLYQFCLPLLEVHGGLTEMYKLNKDLYALKQPKPEAVKNVEDEKKNP